MPRPSQLERSANLVTMWQCSGERQLEPSKMPLSDAFTPSMVKARLASDVFRPVGRVRDFHLSARTNQRHLIDERYVERLTAKAAPHRKIL